MARNGDLPRLILAGFVLLFIVQAVAAFSVGQQTIGPSGTLNPGDAVNVSCTVYAASGTAFSTYDDLQFVTDLNNPVWAYSIVVNGVENVRPRTSGRILTISGFELNYQNRDEVIVKLSLTGTIPLTAATGTTKTLVKIQEMDARGYAIPNSIVTIDHLIGQPTPVPTPAFGSLSITSSPPGADVYLDNVIRGFTPVVLDPVPNGNHALTLRLNGYDDSVNTVTVMGTVKAVSAVLVPRGTETPTETSTTVPGSTPKPGQTTVTPVPATGSLTVVTSPQGASVNIDGEFKGITPATIPGLTAGEHEVSLSLTGYTVLKANIRVEAGKNSEFITGMAAVPKTPGFEMIPALLSLCGVVAVLKIRKGKK